MFNLDSNTLFASLIWGTIGSGMFMFGWKQKSTLPIGCGIAMVALSYFIDSALWMSVASAGVLVFIFWMKKQGY